ncbi:MAG: helix-turn-helix domain-containing protein [Flavobacteriaceae bacterium]|nr:helix-turn-helix domain-containing protein [Flavobacteriaceae bacterium]
MSKKDIIHFIPFVLSFALLSNRYFLSSYERDSFLKDKLGGQLLVVEDINVILMILMLLQNAFYIYVSWQLLRKNESLVKSYHSNSSLIQFSWTKNLTLAFLIFLVIYLCIFLLMNIIRHYTPMIDSLVLVGLSIIILLTAYFALKNPEIYLDDFIKTAKEKYKYSVLSLAERQQLIKKLDNLMESRKPYYKSDLKMSELAEMMSLSNNYLSQIINQEKGVNFFDYVNSFRVEAAKKKLIDPDNRHLTNFAIAYEVGFSNKTSFHRIFKKHCNITPSEFVKANS